MGDKWTLLIVRDLSAGPRRFVELQRVLPGISTEQLRSRLNRMVADGLLTRKRYREVPPRVDYDLTDRARQLMPVLGELARWGYEWAWSPPRASEAVDVSAIFRLVPGLLRPTPEARGTIELILRREGAELSRYTVTLADGQATVLEGEAERPGARISGEVTAWVAALSPEPDASRLSITGEQRLADMVLSGLGASGGRSARQRIAAA